MLTVGSLFAGIGGFDLGLERAGMQVKWQVEIDPYCLKVLEKHWPHVRRYTDIKTVDWSGVAPVDLVCGGFPCQDLSCIGKRAGITGERSGLWSEFFRAIRALQPAYCIVENVPGLLDNPAMGRVLGDLASIGFDAEWQVLPAGAVGANHLRERVWLVAYTKKQQRIYEPHAWKDSQRLFNNGSHWQTSPWDEATPRVCRMDDGVPDRVDRTDRVGRSVVP